MRHTLALALATGLAAAAGLPSPAREPDPASGPLPLRASVRAAALDATELPAPRRTGHRRAPVGDPYATMSMDSLLGFLDELTAIRAHAGWRYSTTAGEDEAMDLVERRLGELKFLRSRGLGVEQHAFRTYGGVDLRESTLEITVSGERFEVPADGIPGHRDNVSLALRFDSDGTLGDSDPDPVLIEGPPLTVRSAAQLASLTPAAVAGRIVFLDYAVVDRVLLDMSVAVDRARSLVEKRPAAIVTVTTYSNVAGVSHGTFSRDIGAFTSVAQEPDVPVFTVTLEDLAAHGISNWGDIPTIESVRITWDADVYEVGLSGNLIAHIPGSDPSRAVILGAHIDSNNTSGALDDGSGSATLLEVARVLDRARTVPPSDLYLVWFGSEERGLYGSFAFTASHSDLLDRTIAMVQMDCLAHPLDGLANYLTLLTWTYARFGDDRLLLPAYLERIAAPETTLIETVPNIYGLGSDHGSFAAYNVPNTHMIYENPYSELQVHYANHFHDPYDTMELAEIEVDVLQDMAQLVLAAALRIPVDDPQLRSTPEPDRRAVFVASHTEGAHMTAGSFTDLGMALGLEGFDVDSIPYGQPVTPEDLVDADLVVALPVHDYPSPEGDVDLYDEAWTAGELDALEGYVRAGGLLVLTNSARRLKYFNLAYEDNEDWPDQNELAQRLGVTFAGGTLADDVAVAVGSHPLVRGVTTLDLAEANSVRFTAAGAETLAHVAGSPAVAVLGVGAGEVLVLADLGLLGNQTGEPQNLTFWRNLALYAR